MPEQTYRIVQGEESNLHGEPHIEESRVTVRFVYEKVEEAGISPGTVADRHGLDIADVYEALAYYHSNPGEMKEVEERHEEAVREAESRSKLTPPDA